MARGPGDDALNGAPGTHDEQRLWLGVRRSTWQAFAYAALAAATLVGFLEDDRQDDRERREDKAELDAQRAHDQQEETNEDYLACIRGNQQRDALRATVQAAYAAGRSDFDVTTLPEWDPVVRESPAVARFLLRLVSPRDGESRSGSNAAAVLATIPANRDCDQAYPDHTPGIEVRAGLPTTTTTAP